MAKDPAWCYFFLYQLKPRALSTWNTYIRWWWLVITLQCLFFFGNIGDNNSDDKCVCSILKLSLYYLTLSNITWTLIQGMNVLVGGSLAWMAEAASFFCQYCIVILIVEMLNIRGVVLKKYIRSKDLWKEWCYPLCVFFLAWKAFLFGSDIHVLTLWENLSIRGVNFT